MNISSPLFDQDTYKFTECQILNLFDKHKLEVQIVKTKSVVKYNDDMKFESGYILKVHHCDDYKGFKDNIWEPLQKKFNLTCGYVVVDKEYMGCILNWPGVFTESNCPTC